MKIRRIPGADAGRPIAQSMIDGAWQELADPPAFLRGGDDAGLPFQPRSFRDFMLYEKHVIDASRGYVRRFMPAAYRATALFEKLARRPFPAFRPHALWYRQPIYYFGNHMTFVPSGTPVRCPSYSDALDYELELGFVLAEPLLNATAEEAVSAIGGFVVLNDLSARDIQRDEMACGFGPQKAKHFLSSMSEVLVTADELLADVDRLEASVRINGELVCATSTAGMRHSLGEALAHASKDEQLHPGEFFGTGTLPGGSGMENGRWLQAGDELHLSIDRIGEITHRIL